MYPILGRYGPFFLYSYSVVLGLGILAATGLMAWHARGDEEPGWFDGLLLMLCVGLITGRLGFVAAHWSYFQHHLSEIGQIWLGGLSYYGAMMGGFLALWGWSARNKRAGRRLAGLLASGLALAAVFGWLACWLEGCAYGRQALVGLLTADLPDELGVYALRYRTQQIGMILSLLTWLAVTRLRRNWPSLRLFWLAILGLSLSRFLTSLLRGDSMPELWQIRVDTLADAALTLISLILIQYKRQ